MKQSGREEPDVSDLSAYWDRRAERESSRETEDPRKRVHTDLLWRMIERALPERGGTILDAGGGTGRFSLPLARRGFRVTHLDIAPRMIEIAQQEAEGLDTIAFCVGDIVDLSRFSDASFDLVLCLDSPLSFCFRDHERALDELVRVCRHDLVLCATSRLGAIAEGGITFDLQHFGVPRTAWEVLETGDLDVTDELLKTQPLMSSWHAFTAAELVDKIAVRGLSVRAVLAPGGLARFIPPEALLEVFREPYRYARFLDFEERFDRQPGVLDIAAPGAGGIALHAKRARSRPDRKTVG